VNREFFVFACAALCFSHCLGGYNNATGGTLSIAENGKAARARIGNQKSRNFIFENLRSQETDTSSYIDPGNDLMVLTRYGDGLGLDTWMVLTRYNLMGLTRNQRDPRGILQLHGCSGERRQGVRTSEPQGMAGAARCQDDEGLLAVFSENSRRVYVLPLIFWFYSLIFRADVGVHRHDVLLRLGRKVCLVCQSTLCYVSPSIDGFDCRSRVIIYLNFDGFDQQDG
jgi:hypothetical protein